MNETAAGSFERPFKNNSRQFRESRISAWHEYSMRSDKASADYRIHSKSAGTMESAMWHEGSSCAAHLSAWHREAGLRAGSWRHCVHRHVGDGQVRSFAGKVAMETHESAESVEQMLSRICGEYLEMPGMRLTCAQAERLCGLEAGVCRELLETLVEAKFLWRTKDGAYARLTGSSVSAPPRRMAKANASEKAIWGRKRADLNAASG